MRCSENYLGKAAHFILNRPFVVIMAITLSSTIMSGGNVVIMPNVCIGNNVVIGAGSVVTRDIPDNSIAAGNPCRVLRMLNYDDRRYYFKNREF